MLLRWDISIYVHPVLASLASSKPWFPSLSLHSLLFSFPLHHPPIYIRSSFAVEICPFVAAISSWPEQSSAVEPALAWTEDLGWRSMRVIWSGMLSTFWKHSL